MKLCGTGWLDWDEFTRNVNDWNAVWVDLGGAHLGPMPVSVPEATHVWAWSEECWVRARVDEGDVVAGFLHAEGACPRGNQECPDAMVGEVLRTQSWAEAHINVGNLRNQEWEIIETIEGVTATFVRALDSDGSRAG